MEYSIEGDQLLLKTKLISILWPEKPTQKLRQTLETAETSSTNVQSITNIEKELFWGKGDKNGLKYQETPESKEKPSNSLNVLC